VGWYADRELLIDEGHKNEREKEELSLLDLFQLPPYAVQATDKDPLQYCHYCFCLTYEASFLNPELRTSPSRLLSSGLPSRRMTAKAAISRPSTQILLL
jgi:hypothetical protein